jgi:hypothetical protein
MRLPTYALLGLAACASLGLAPRASANGRNPGSLLLYPEFDNRSSHLTLLTVTNTNTGINPDGSNGTVKVEFVYIGKYGTNGIVLPCLETNRTETLTANDTLSLLTSVHNPNAEQGYVYVFAKDVLTNRAIAFNYLIGNLLTLESLDQLEYSMNPVAFKGFPTNPAGETNADNDSVRDLDGVEYEPVADQIYIPRFIGSSTAAPAAQVPVAQYDSELIMIGLSGGIRFETVIDFLIYNDNEEVFSAQYQIRCWDRVKLRDINGVFTQDFLHNFTNHAANEIIGAPNVEAGWIRLNGAVAWSTAEAINDPAIYAVLVERISGFAAADLPFESVATQNNGDLLPATLFGDPSGNNHDNQ